MPRAGAFLGHFPAECILYSFPLTSEVKCPAEHHLSLGSVDLLQLELEVALAYSDTRVSGQEEIPRMGHAGMCVCERQRQRQRQN